MVNEANQVGLKDGVNRSHYARFTIQPIDFIRKNNLPWDQGEIIKYICRYPYKNGVEDLKKARDILDRMIQEKNTLLSDFKINQAVAEGEVQKAQAVVMRPAAMVPEYNHSPWQQKLDLGIRDDE